MADQSAARVHFQVIKYMHEAGLKLHLESIPLATASTIYHKFFRQANVEDFDPYLIGATCLSLACKAEEENVKLRDIVNVCYRTLHKTKAPLEINDTFWGLRESIASCELYVLRALKFKVIFTHPHKYLVHYLRALSDWLEPSVRDEVPVAHTAWGLLRDSYHWAVCLDHPPDHVAVAVIYLALQAHGVEVPGQQQAKKKWWQVFCDDISLDVIERVTSQLMDVYDLETGLPPAAPATALTPVPPPTGAPLPPAGLGR